MSVGPDPVVIVGGGLSGLVAAVQLVDAGWPVQLFDSADEVGGRARTHCRQGFHLNMGPHRLFERGAAVVELRRLGLSLPTAPRGPNGGFAIWQGAKHTMPTGCCSLLVTGLFGVAAKVELGRFLTALPIVDVATLQDVPLEEWLRTQLTDPRVVQFVLAMVRFTSYTHDPGRQSAAAAIEQMKLSLGGPILYVHQGWGSLVTALRTAAAGATIETARAVTRVNVTAGRAMSVTLSDGRTVACRAVIVTTGPKPAHALLGDAAMPQPSAIPICVAALDLALSRLPARQAVFAMGIDDPVCFSADSVIARLAPGVGAVVHAARYLTAGAAGTSEDEATLERLMDLMQPGWRDVVVFRRFLPRAVVSHAMVTASGGGMAGRPSGRVPGLENVFLAGDWIGPTGQLADAAIASGVRAARALQSLAT
jgi:phytoene dehydrogenase-like protein